MADGERSTLTVRRVRRNPWVMGLAAVPWALLPVVLVIGLLVDPQVLMTLPHLSIFGAVATLYAWRRNPRPRLEDVQVRVTEEVVHVGPEAIPRSEIAGGYLVPQRRGAIVKLQRRGMKPALELQVDDEAEGQQLLRELGVAETQTVARFTTMPRTHATGAGRAAAALGVIPTVALWALLGSVSPIAGGLALVTGIATIMALLLAPARVDVGADGVLLSWLGRRRFVPYEAIREVKERRRGRGRYRLHMLELDLGPSDTLRIPVSTLQWDFGKTRSLARRIREAQAAHERSDATHAEALLRRGDRSHREWVAALRVGEQVATHRTSTVDGQRLWRIVEDTATPPMERAAAAVALGSELPEEERGRLRRIAAATAQPRLRIVLETAGAEEEVEALLEALAELEADDERQRAKGSA